MSSISDAHRVRICLRASTAWRRGLGFRPGGLSAATARSEIRSQLFQRQDRSATSGARRGSLSLPDFLTCLPGCLAGWLVLARSFATIVRSTFAPRDAPRKSDDESRRSRIGEVKCRDDPEEPRSQRAEIAVTLQRIDPRIDGEPQEIRIPLGRGQFELMQSAIVVAKRGFDVRELSGSNALIPRRHVAR